MSLSSAPDSTDNARARPAGLGYEFCQPLRRAESDVVTHSLEVPIVQQMHKIILPARKVIVYVQNVIPVAR